MNATRVALGQLLKGLVRKPLETADYTTPLIHDQQVTEDICIQFEVIKVQVGEAKQCPKFDLKKKNKKTVTSGPKKL